MEACEAHKTACRQVIASKLLTADPMLNASDTNHNALPAILTDDPLSLTENCKVVAATPAKNVATVAALSRIAADRF
jgi:hypothetical protein